MVLRVDRPAGSAGVSDGEHVAVLEFQRAESDEAAVSADAGGDVRGDFCYLELVTAGFVGDVGHVYDERFDYQGGCFDSQAFATSGTEGGDSGWLT